MKLLIADDDNLVREGLKILLDIDDDIDVIGTASNGQEALEFCKNSQPDIILMDIRMPIMDGVLATKHIKKQFPNIKVIILTTFKDDEYIREAVKSGAEGYMLKNQSPESIIDSMRAVLNGTSVFEKNVATKLSEMLTDRRKNASPSDYGLTNREMDILNLIGEGMSNSEIAEKLFLTDGTIRNYVTGMLEKLNLRDRTQLALFHAKNF